MPTLNDDAIIANSIFANQPLISNANAVCRSVSIGNGNSLTMSGSRQLQVSGAFFTNNGNFIAGSANEIVEFTGAVTINGTNPTSFNNCILNNGTQLTAGVIPTIIGVLTLNPNSFVNTAPFYGSSSRLNYNIGGTYNVGNEWTGSTVFSGLGNPNDVSITNNTTLILPATTRGIAGTMFITSGTLQMNTANNADLIIGKDWQRTSGTGIFVPNNKAVIFRGFGNQEIRIIGGGTEIFNYLIIDKSIAGTYLRPSNTGGSTTNITINGTTGDVLQLLGNGQLDLNGRIICLDRNDPFNNTGNILVSGIQRIVNTAAGGQNAGSFAITGSNNINQPTYRTKSVRSNNATGRLIFDNSVLVTIADGMMDFGFDGTTNLTTIEGVLQVNLGGSVWPNSCYFSGPTPASTLRFANTIDYQVNSFDKTWAQGAIYSGLPGIPWNVEVNNTNTDLTINDVRALRNNLTITDGRFTLLAGPFNIGGNWTRVNPAGTTVPPCAFTPNTNKVVFDKTGTGDQIITCTAFDSVETFYDLEISPATVNVQLAPLTDVVVSNGLFLTTGKLDLNDDTLTLGYSGFAGSLTGGGLNSYILGYKTDVNGVFKRFVPTNGLYSYPFGDVNNFTPIQLDFISGNYGPQAFVEGSLYDTVHPNMSPYIEYISRYWKMLGNDITLPVFTATYRYTDNDVVGNESNILPFRFDTSWVGSGGSLASVIVGFGTISTALNQLNWNSMTSFGDFTGIGYTNPLPISLLSFEAIAEGNDALINWSTSSEINNDYFTVERSWNGIDFEPIHIEPGAGNSNSTLHYSHLDRNVSINGKRIAYYRLKQTDFDGKFSNSEIAAVLFNGNGLKGMVTFPNPFHDRLVIALNDNVGNTATIELFDALGKLVLSKQIYFDDSENVVILDGMENSAPGVYTLRFSSDNSAEFVRIIKK